MKTVNKGSRVLLRLLFLVYAAAMLWLLFGQRIGDEGVTIHLNTSGENLNLVPLMTVKHYIWLIQNSTNRALIRHAVINLAGNVVLFVPLGWFLPYNWKNFRGIIKVLFPMLLMIVTVEIAQYFTLLGSCDIDDLILNLLGVLIGYILWRIGTHRQNRK